MASRAEIILIRALAAPVAVYVCDTASRLPLNFGVRSCIEASPRSESKGQPRIDRDALEATHRKQVALVTRGDEISLAGDGRRADERAGVRSCIAAPLTTPVVSL